MHKIHLLSNLVANVGFEQTLSPILPPAPMSQQRRKLLEAELMLPDAFSSELPRFKHRPPGLHTGGSPEPPDFQLTSWTHKKP